MSDVRVLDFGSKDDRLKKLIEYYQKTSEYVMMDAEPMSSEVISFKYEEGSVLPFDDGYFDLVICASVVEYIEDVPGILREFIRVLKSGGEIRITYPTFWWDMHKTKGHVLRHLKKMKDVNYEYGTIGGRVFGYYYFRITKKKDSEVVV